MNDLVQQLLTRTQHFPKGGMLHVMERNVREQPEPLNPRWRDPNVAARYKRIYEMRQSGMTYRAIGEQMNISHTAASYGARMHEVSMGNDDV